MVSESILMLASGPPEDIEASRPPPMTTPAMPTTKAVLLAAGTGTRLRPLTDSIPKCLLTFAGRSLLDLWLHALAHAGIRDILINTHAHAGLVRDWIARVNRRGGIRIHESHEPDLLGSAGTIAANPRFADDADSIFLIYADNLSDVNLRQMLGYHRQHHDPLTMLLFHAQTPSACGIAELDDDGRVIGFVEKPQRPVSDLANAGVYITTAAAYREIAAMHARDIGYDVLPHMIGRMRGWQPPSMFHLDIGTPDNYASALRNAPRLLAQRGYGPQGRRPAIFLDRDGTLIQHVHHLHDPDQVTLMDDAPQALTALREAGYALVVVSNQSAVGRGLFDEAAVHRVNERMCDLLAQHGVVLDALYHCTLAPITNDRTRIEHPDRKPGPGMLQRAAAELALDLSRSWMLGDMVSDVLAGQNAGCRGSLLIGSPEQLTDTEHHAIKPLDAFPNLARASQHILRLKRSHSPLGSRQNTVPAVSAITTTPSPIAGVAFIPRLAANSHSFLPVFKSST